MPEAVARKAPAELNMCGLLSFSLNNTRYLARDKCLNRRIAEGPAKLVYFAPLPECFALWRSTIPSSLACFFLSNRKRDRHSVRHLSHRVAIHLVTSRYIPKSIYLRRPIPKMFINLALLFGFASW